MLTEQKFQPEQEISVPHERLYVRAFMVLSFSLCTAIAARIEIPVQPVPFTLQTFFVLLSGAILGKRDGFFSMGLYLILGACGLPVFTGGGFGLMKLLGPTGGYLLAFPIASFVVGYLVSLYKNYWWVATSMIVGAFIIFLFGTIQLNYVYLHDWKTSLQSGLLIFSFWDALKIIAAASITRYFLK